MIRRLERALLALAIAVTCGCSREPAPERAQETPPPPPPARAGFLAPRGGEVWMEGSTYVVRWRAPGWGKVHVGAAMGGKDKGHLGFNLDAAVDSLVWQIPEGFVTGFGPARSDAMRLRLESADDANQFVDSDTFTIVGRAREP